MTTDQIVALLPMKGHSERVPGKNFRLLCGRPLFRWMLDTLLSIEEIARVVINTDAYELVNEMVQDLPDRSRIFVRNRPQEICGDLVSMNRVIADDIANVPAQIYLMTHTTNPFLSANTIRGAMEAYMAALRSNGTESLFTVNRVQARFYRQDCSAINHNPSELIRTQDLEPWFEENSNLYIFTYNSFSNAKARIGTTPMMYETPRVEALDIDDEEDWLLAEAIAGNLGIST